MNFLEGKNGCGNKDMMMLFLLLFLCDGFDGEDNNFMFIILLLFCC